MANSREVLWKRVTAEGITIVASILLAFGIEAWWSDRQNAIEEIAVLEPLKEELAQLRRSISDNRTYAEGIRSATAKLVNLTLDGVSSDQNDEVDRLLTDFMWQINPSFANTPVLESVIFTGDLELISDGQLRRALSQIHVSVTTLRAEVARELNYYDATVIPFLQKNADLAQFFTRPSVQPGFPNETYVYEGLSPSPAKPQLELLRNREFQNILLHRLTTLQNALYWHGIDIDERLEEVVNMIDEEVGAR
jgi:hypothetical protein